MLEHIATMHTPSMHTLSMHTCTMRTFTQVMRVRESSARAPPSQSQPLTASPPPEEHHHLGKRPILESPSDITTAGADEEVPPGLGQLGFYVKPVSDPQGLVHYMVSSVTRGSDAWDKSLRHSSVLLSGVYGYIYAHTHVRTQMCTCARAHARTHKCMYVK